MFSFGIDKIDVLNLITKYSFFSRQARFDVSSLDNKKYIYIFWEYQKTNN